MLDWKIKLNSVLHAMKYEPDCCWDSFHKPLHQTRENKQIRNVKI